MRGMEALLRSLLEAVAHDAIERRWKAWVCLQEVGRIFLEDRVHRLRRRAALEGPTSAEHLVEDDTEREDIGGGAGRLAAHLLGRHIANGSQDGPGVGVARECRRAGVIAGHDRLPREPEV